MYVQKSYKSIFRYLLTGLVVLFSFAANAQIEFKASSSKYKVKKNERFQISFSLNASGKDFIGPAFEDFYVLSGPNPSSMINIVNGRRSSKNTYTYILKPRKLGQFKIAPATVKADGETYTSNAVTIAVVEGKTDGEVALEELKDDIFVRVQLNRNTAYQGEQIIASYVLYYNQSIQNLEIDQSPSLKGFWQKELNLKQNQRSGEAEYNGYKYNTYILKKSIVIPQKFGKLIFDPMKVTVGVNLPTKKRNMWGQWISRREDMQLVSAPREINIKPLPLEGKPANFNGAVGDFNLSSSISSDSINTNESVSLTVKLTGKGNLPLFKIPKLETPPDVEAYDPKNSDKITQNASGIRGKKEDQYILIPRNKGTYTIPAQQFSYFDPSKKEYIKLSTQAYKLKVGGSGLGNSPQVISNINKKDVDFIGKDVLYIKSKTSLQTGKSTFFNKKSYILIWFIPLIAALLIFLFKVIVLDREKDEHSIKVKKAGRKALKLLGQAQAHIKQNDSKVFYAKSLEAIYGYLREKLDIDVSDFQMDDIKDALNKKEVSETLISDLEKVIENCQIANYGASLSSSSMEQDLLKSKEIITQLEKLL